MDANTKPSLLTKLLRPDKKTKPKPDDEENRRYSTPVHGWWESPVSQTTENKSKPQEQKQTQKKMHSSQQNLSELKKQKTTKPKPTPSKEKRKPRSSWFCMSGNADTLDKSSMPVQNKNNKNASINSKNKDKHTGTHVPADILRQNGGKKSRENKNRHSAPDFSTAKTLAEGEDTEAAKKAPTGKSHETSPGVRYRFDGTLEKPYVFPAGLTFGPEGRKLHLRRSSNNLVEVKPPIIPPRTSEKLVKAEVHKSSTEDLIMEYGYEESEPFWSEFDVQKAFYLKYDSNLANPAGHTDNVDAGHTKSSLSRSGQLDAQKQDTRWKPKESSSNASLRNSRRQLRAERSKNRYSMPIKNDNFVYMGSCENLSMSNDMEQDSRMAQSSFDVSTRHEIGTHNHNKIDRRHRYSTPIKNNDFVCMGSFESIYRILNLEKPPDFSLPKEDVISVISKNSSSSENLVDNSKRPEDRRQSLTNLAVVSGSSLTDISNTKGPEEESLPQEHENQKEVSVGQINSSSPKNVAKIINSSEETSVRQVKRRSNAVDSAVASCSNLTNISKNKNSSENVRDTSMPQKKKNLSVASGSGLTNISDKINIADKTHVGKQHRSQNETNFSVVSGSSLTNLSRKISNSERHKDTHFRQEDTRHSLTNLTVASGPSITNNSRKINNSEKRQIMQQDGTKPSETNLTVASGPSITNNSRKINNTEKRQHMQQEHTRSSLTNLTVASGSSIINSSRTINESEKSKETILRKDETRQSLTNLAVTSGSSLTNITNNINSSEGYKDAEHDDEEYDRFDDSLLSIGSAHSYTQENPFLKRTGRTSYNPGNKRDFVPPPIIISPSLSPPSTAAPSSANMTLVSFMPGNKPFSIPPPPSYTPPKDEMDFSLIHKTDTKCHRDSQTDILTEFDSLNMEDRDASLRLAEVKTIFAGNSSRSRNEDSRGPGESPKHKSKNHDQFTNVRHSNASSSTLEQQPPKPSQFSGGAVRAAQRSLFNKCELETSPKITKPPTTNNKWETNLLVNSSPIVYLPNRNNGITKETSQIANEVKTFDRVTKNVPSETKHVTTSPLTKRDNLQSNFTNGSKPRVPQPRPVPPPRTIYNPPGLITRADQSSSKEHKGNSHQRGNVSAPPVPKKRNSLAYSRSLSSARDFCKLEPVQEASGDSKKWNNGKLARTQSCEPGSTLQRRQNAETATDNIYEVVNDDHQYEEIGCENQENIYEVCDEVRSDKYNGEGGISKSGGKGKVKLSDLEKWLTPLRKIKLESSPGQQRRNRPKGKMTAVHTGLAHSLDELADVFAEKRFHFYDNDDNSSIADDEMSLSNEEDMDERLHSLRRCVSADNLLRSGSILDRSMILAQRRRRRMRERRSTSQIFTDNKDFMNFNALSNLTNFGTNTNSTKIRYNKRKATSNERLFKYKANHTDSGHDSEIVSPCTSPNARRHHSNTGPPGDQRPLQELDDPNAPRQGTLPKKPWEIRLRNLQYQKKSRSRENLLTLAPQI